MLLIELSQNLKKYGRIMSNNDYFKGDLRVIFCQGTRISVSSNESSHYLARFEGEIPRFPGSKIMQKKDKNFIKTNLFAINTVRIYTV